MGSDIFLSSSEIVEVLLTRRLGFLQGAGGAVFGPFALQEVREGHGRRCLSQELNDQ